MQTRPPDTPARRIAVSLFIIEDTTVIIVRDEEEEPIRIIFVYDRHDAQEVLDDLLRDEISPPHSELSLRERFQTMLEANDSELPLVSTRTRIEIPQNALAQIDEYLCAGLETLGHAQGLSLEQLFAGLPQTKQYSSIWASDETAETNTCLLVLYAHSPEGEPTATVVGSKIALRSLLNGLPEATDRAHIANLRSLLPFLTKAMGSHHPIHLGPTLAKLLIVGERVIAGLIENAYNQPESN